MAVHPHTAGGTIVRLRRTSRFLPNRPPHPHLLHQSRRRRAIIITTRQARVVVRDLVSLDDKTLRSSVALTYPPDCVTITIVITITTIHIHFANTRMLSPCLLISFPFSLLCRSSFFPFYYSFYFPRLLFLFQLSRFSLYYFV